MDDDADDDDDDGDDGLDPEKPGVTIGIVITIKVFLFRIFPIVFTSADL